MTIARQRPANTLDISIDGTLGHEILVKAAEVRHGVVRT